MSKKLSPLLAVSVVLMFASACARHGAALIVSEPGGAEVWDMSDSTLFGITPVQVRWMEHGEKRKFVNVRLQKEGYRDKTTSFWVNLDHATSAQALRDPQPVEVTLDKK